jgi:hypothetical protein
MLPILRVSFDIGYPLVIFRHDRKTLRDYLISLGMMVGSTTYATEEHSTQ